MELTSNDTLTSSNDTDFDPTYIVVGFGVGVLAFTLSAYYYLPMLISSPSIDTGIQHLAMTQAIIIFLIDIGALAILKLMRRPSLLSMFGLVCGECIGFVIYIVLVIIFIFLLAVFSAGFFQQ